MLPLPLPAIPPLWRGLAVALATAVIVGWMVWQARQIDGLTAQLATCQAAAAKADKDAAIMLGERQRRAMAQADTAATTEAAVRRRATTIRETIRHADDAPMAPALRRAVDGLRRQADAPDPVTHP